MMRKHERGCNFVFFGLMLSFLLFVSPVEMRAAGDFEVTVQASRTQGVAPLSVFFDATQTPSLSDGSFMDATFAWQFDMDNVNPDGLYREASGFVAAHVYEKPGTYRARVTVYDNLGRKAWEDVTITVLPFTGTTYYVAQNGSDENDGLSMSTPVQTVGHALGVLAVPNTRILFRKGDTFETRFVNASGKPGPVVISSYEDPGRPSDEPPIIYNTAVNSDWATVYIGTDWRMMDLKVRSGGSSAGEVGPRYPGGIGFGSATSHGLIYRVEQYDLASQWMDPYGQYNTVAQCNIHRVSGTGFSSDGDGGALIGNWVHDKGEEDPEHIFRLQGGTRYFIAFNHFEANVVNFDSLTIRGNTEKVVIYKNILDRATGIWPQNRNSAEEYQRYCIIDSNLFIGRDNPPNYITTTPIRQTAINLHAKDIVIRNNIIYNYEFAVNIGDDTVVGPSQRIKVYHNTVINRTPGSYFFFVSADPGCFDIEVKNNLMLDLAGSNLTQTRLIRVRKNSNLFNGTSNSNLFYGDTWNAGMALFTDYSLSQWQSETGNDLASRLLNPELASHDIESANFMRPSQSSPVVNAGEFTAAALDYAGNLRDLSRDIGALEYASEQGDLENPTAPAGLHATASEYNRVDLSWSASTDNVGVAGYRIFRDGAPIGTTVSTTYFDTGCAASTTYAYTVRAFDTSGNISAASNLISVTTPAQASNGGSGGDAGGGGGGCFIATAAYGSHLHVHVSVLRKFRDTHLLTCAPGRAFVEIYYRYSPPVAVFIARHEIAKYATRLALMPLVYAVAYPEWVWLCLMVTGCLSGFCMYWRKAQCSRC